MTADLALPAARSLDAIRAAVAAWRREGLSVGFVPTMGALHAGHVSLARIAVESADRVVVSIFVNPAQFAPHEDFDRYPRTEQADAERLKASGAAHLLYVPSVATMYPDGAVTRVRVGGPSAGLESDARPHFFEGVATVVTMLLNHVGPDVAVFGEKDYQQLQVVRQLVRDLALPVRIIAGPTLRESDGLAMSSRNAYLTQAERRIAGAMNVILSEAAARAVAGAPLPGVAAEAEEALKKAGFAAVDYVTIRDAETLAPLMALDRPARILAAARVGSTRLIDNMPVG